MTQRAIAHKRESELAEYNENFKVSLTKTYPNYFKRFNAEALIYKLKEIDKLFNGF